MARSILAQVTRRNSYDFTCQHQESILCEHAVVEGIYWRIPTSKAGVHTGFIYRKSDTKPTPDSMKTIRVNDKVNNITYYVAIADDEDASAFTNACEACCDDVQPMDLVAMPDILIEEEGCPNEDGDYIFFAIVTTPAPGGSVYKLSGSVNGEALPAAPPEGFASLAALESWADSNWSTGDLDGVTLDGGKVMLNAGPSGKTGVINVSLAKYFESNAPGSLTDGQNYHLAATINGNVLTALDTDDDAALSTMADLANNTAAYAAYGTWVVTGGKLRLVEDGKTLTSATLVITKV